MSGIDTLKKLRQLLPTSRIIMLSAADHYEVAEGVLKLGADRYVCKPPSLRELERLVNSSWPSETRRN
jgi:DNA-binding response OmpR family regulator